LLEIDCCWSLVYFSRSQVSYTMEYLARSIEAVLSDAKVKRAVLVGHSMGTPVIRQFYRVFPEKTVGLVIVDGALRILFPEEQTDQFMTPLRTNYQAAATERPKEFDQAVQEYLTKNKLLKK